MNNKRDYHYMGLAILIVLAGLAYEESYYEVGAIIVALITGFSEIKGGYDDSR